MYLCSISSNCRLIYWWDLFRVDVLLTDIRNYGMIDWQEEFILERDLEKLIRRKGVMEHDDESETLIFDWTKSLNRFPMKLVSFSCDDRRKNFTATLSIKLTEVLKLIFVNCILQLSKQWINEKSANHVFIHMQYSYEVLRKMFLVCRRQWWWSLSREIHWLSMEIDEQSVWEALLFLSWPGFIWLSTRPIVMREKISNKTCLEIIVLPCNVWLIVEIRFFSFFVNNSYEQNNGWSVRWSHHCQRWCLDDHSFEQNVQYLNRKRCTSHSFLSSIRSSRQSIEFVQSNERNTWNKWCFDWLVFPAIFTDIFHCVLVRENDRNSSTKFCWKQFRMHVTVVDIIDHRCTTESKNKLERHLGNKIFLTCVISSNLRSNVPSQKR